MIVFGGAESELTGQGQLFNDGAMYDASNDSWTPLPTQGAPAARFGHGAVWTGSEMLVFGGIGAGGAALTSAAAFNPATNTWRDLPATPARRHATHRRLVRPGLARLRSRRTRHPRSFARPLPLHSLLAGRSQLSLFMKTGLFVLTFASLALIARSDPAQQPVGSEIVGFESFDIPAADGPGKTQLSLKAIGLLKPAEYQGVAESHRARTLIDRQSAWADNQFSPVDGTLATATHYLEITTGLLAGATFDIVRTEAATHRLTLAETLPAAVGAGFGFRVRRHWTLAGLFGATDEAGLQPGSETTADLVSLYNGKAYVSFYFNNLTDHPGWHRVGGGDHDEAGRQLYPDDGLSILRRSETAVSPFVTGVVKTDRILIAVQKGLNLVANTYQVPLTLASSNLFTHNPATGPQLRRQRDPRR